MTYTPTRDEFAKLTAAIRGSRSRLGEAIGDFIEFLAFTGARKEEAATILWSDVDLKLGKARFRETKNGKTRSIDLSPAALSLLERIRANRGGEVSPERKVFLVGEAYGALRKAAEAIGIPRISHHDLRDFFATTAIESGVDIPTVSDWLGHQDGGTLLLERYRKHRDEHSKDAAKRIDFSVVVLPMDTVAESPLAPSPSGGNSRSNSKNFPPTGERRR